MDALEGQDRARFERHLERCEECTREVAGLREATARLAAAAAAQPPAALRELLLAETARTRQLPPLTRAAPAEPARRPAPGRAGGRLRSWLGAPRLAAVLAGAAVLVAVAVWAGGAAFRPAHPGPPAGNHGIAAVLTAPDLLVISGRVRTGGTGTVIMSHRERMLVFTAAGLRPLPGSQCYELWLMARGLDRRAALLPMPSHGMSGPVVASGLRPGDRLGLSVEPATGSRRPTSPMILVLVL
jgi:hypothetical protein